MNLKSIIASFTLFLFVLLNSSAGQTKDILNENELSIVMLHNTVSYYNGILNKDVKVVTIPFDTIAIKELIKKNKEKYEGRLRIFIKLSDKISVIEPAVKISEIATRQGVFATAFPLTETDRSYFNVKEFSWEPPEPVEVVTPRSVTTKVEDTYPSFLVQIKADSSVWYNIIEAKEDTMLQNIAEPIKENLKKVIADYKANCEKAGLRTTYFIQGHNAMKYTRFKEILAAFKENEVFNFKMMTLPESAVLEISEEPGKLNLYMPREEEGDEMYRKYDSVETKLTLLLLKNNVIFAYAGNDIKTGKNYNYQDMRKVILDGSKKHKDKFVVVIKPAKGASYKNSVDILDEMAINNISRYVMLHPTKKENQFLKIEE